MQRTAACLAEVERCSVFKMPTDTQTIAGAIFAGMLAIGGAIRWSVGVFTKSQNRAVSALIESAKSHAIMIVKFDSLTARFEGLTARFDRIVDALLRDPTLVRDPKLDDSQRARLATGHKRKGSSSGSG